MLSEQRIVLVGCGHMGGAMLRGWLAAGVRVEHVRIVDPQAESMDGVSVVGSAAELGDFAPDVIVLAVKPQLFDDVLPDYTLYTDALFVSIAAGKSLAAMERLLGDVALVRAMPNLPATVGKGVSAYIGNDRVSEDQQELAKQLLEAVGIAVALEDEALINAVTAVSGSGPAYFFHMAEAMVAAGVAEGLSESQALELVRGTIAGAAVQLEQSGEAPGALREKVTSKGGTTAAALDVFMDDDALANLVQQAVSAARKRAETLE